MNEHPLIVLQQVKTREELLFAWNVCAAIAREFPNDSHWGEVVKAFRQRGQELGTDLNK